uniref:Pancreatic triacylglycerol lipase n=2 Tax=Lygus hesperus TaxID=30085 RepID=A0A146MBK9_LYGHE
MPSVTSSVRMIGFASLLVTLLTSTVRSSNVGYNSTEWLPSENSTGTAWNDSIVITTYANDALVDNVDFYLYTQKTQNTPVKTRITDTKLFGGKIDIAKPVKILIHGYMSNKDKFFSKTMREAYLNKGDYNVINVDWSKDARSLYNTARNDVPAVGKVVAKFIDRLVAETRVKAELLHIVGHSLGAHIAGVAGLNIQSGLLMRVTGLDPAGPLFSYNDEERLKPSSAGFVDVIHTCGKGLGFFGDLGHVDFYPNQGTAGQPGCSLSFGKCSHQRAIQLFAESLSTPNGFLGRKCDHWKEYTAGQCDNNPTAFMGEYVGFDARGKYWMRTGNSSPFALGPSGVIEGTAKAKRRISTPALQSLQGGGLG